MIYLHQSHVGVMLVVGEEFIYFLLLSSYTSNISAFLNYNFDGVHVPKMFLGD